MVAMLKYFAMREKRETEWIRRGEFERKVMLIPGYDCRVQCEHDVKGEHGQHGDELMLCLRIASHRLPADNPMTAQFALTLHIMTYVRDGKFLELAREFKAAKAYELTSHHVYPTDEDIVRRGGAPTDCNILAAGKCYTGFSGYTAGDLLWTPQETDLIGARLASPEVEHIVLHLDTDIWSRMETFMFDLQQKALAEHAALPKQCPMCKGHGLIPKSGGNG